MTGSLYKQLNCALSVIKHQFTILAQQRPLQRVRGGVVAALSLKLILGLLRTGIPAIAQTAFKVVYPVIAAPGPLLHSLHVRERLKIPTAMTGSQPAAVCGLL
jgi:hypothetical protein